MFTSPNGRRRFVFEGKPPQAKRDELAKRSSKREGAHAELAAAKEVGGGRGGRAGKEHML